MYVDELTALHAGFFRTDAHEVAFDGRRKGGGLYGFSRQHAVERSDKTLVAATVAVALFVQVRQGDIFHRRQAKAAYGERT